MPDLQRLRHLRLHFEGVLTHGHRLPAPTLVQALQQLQRIVHLLAMAHEGREVKQRARVTRDIERRFPLICELPQEGGYAVPVEIGQTGHQLFDRQIVEEVATKARAVMDAVSHGSSGELILLLPEGYYRRAVINAFAAMQPSPHSGLVLHLEDVARQRLMDGRVAPQLIANMLAPREIDAAAAPGYVTGALIEMKFQERRMRLQLLQSGKALDATYSDDFEPVLLDHPREIIQVHGNVVYGEDGQPIAVSDVDKVLEVDDSPIEVVAVQVANKNLRALRPLSFDVTFDREKELFGIDGPFGICLAAETRRDLESQLDDELKLLWQEYASADEVHLSPAAIRLKAELGNTFDEIDDDA